MRGYMAGRDDTDLAYALIRDEFDTVHVTTDKSTVSVIPDIVDDETTGEASMTDSLVNSVENVGKVDYAKRIIEYVGAKLNEGNADAVIKEASDMGNLSRIYEGWMAWI
jgi:hypothetical protein